MKNIFSFLVFGLLFGSLSAQITLNQGDMAVLGQRILQATDTLPTVNEGNAGPAQTWDFSSLNRHYLDTITYVNPDSTPFGASFPDATVSTETDRDGNLTYGYLMANPSGVWALGGAGDPFNLGQNFLVNFNPTIKVMLFPYSYGSSYPDTSGISLEFPGTLLGLPVDSVRYKNVSFYEIEADAWGSMSLDGGNFNCLRQKTITHSLDSIWTKVPILGWYLYQSTDKTDSSFTWWDKAHGHALASLGYKNGTINNVTFVDSMVVGLASELHLPSLLKAFPNPSAGTFGIETDLIRPHRFEVLDLTGKLVFEGIFNPLSPVIDLSELEQGAYILSVSDSEGRKAGNSRVQILH